MDENQSRTERGTEMKNELKVDEYTHALVREFVNNKGLNRKTKKFLSNIFNQGEPEDIYVSMLECTRCCYEDESYTEYGILDPEDFGGMDALVDLLEDQKQFNNSMYDCSGRYVTAYQLVHVNPTGLVSFVHHLVLDV